MFVVGCQVNHENVTLYLVAPGLAVREGRKAGPPVGVVRYLNILHHRHLVTKRIDPVLQIFHIVAADVIRFAVLTDDIVFTSFDVADVIFVGHGIVG